MGLPASFLADGSMLLKEMFTTRADRFDVSGKLLATIDPPAGGCERLGRTPDTAGGW